MSRPRLHTTRVKHNSASYRMTFIRGMPERKETKDSAPSLFGFESAEKSSTQQAQRREMWAARGEHRVNTRPLIKKREMPQSCQSLVSCSAKLNKKGENPGTHVLFHSSFFVHHHRRTVPGTKPHHSAPSQNKTPQQVTAKTQQPSTRISAPPPQS